MHPLSDLDLSNFVSFACPVECFILFHWGVLRGFVFCPCNPCVPPSAGPVPKNKRSGGDCLSAQVGACPPSASPLGEAGGWVCG